MNIKDAPLIQDQLDNVNKKISEIREVVGSRFIGFENVKFSANQILDKLKSELQLQESLLLEIEGTLYKREN